MVLGHHQVLLQAETVDPWLAVGWSRGGGSCLSVCFAVRGGRPSCGFLVGKLQLFIYPSARIWDFGRENPAQDIFRGVEGISKALYVRYLALVMGSLGHARTIKAILQVISYFPLSHPFVYPLFLCP